MTKHNNSQEIKELIGLDFGEKRIGVARINTAARFGEALTVINTDDKQLLQRIDEVVNKYNAVGIVVGLARGLDGQETSQTNETRKFALRLAKNLDAAVYLLDEAVSTQEAKKRLAHGAKGQLDSVAAAVILEDFVSQKEWLNYIVKGS